jgi:hypothetical protein
MQSALNCDKEYLASYMMLLVIANSIFVRKYKMESCSNISEIYKNGIYLKLKPLKIGGSFSFVQYL